ncbi:MAG: RdgB/HAM1 family non-canonical purine NTP pyrophosphatase [Candidatus Obscuribacterales bacterium]|nr:RdgB/HAM1 family non-canonical purine NTP pyrophosphatase [Steroidobacteraceae bacterium]
MARVVLASNNRGKLAELAELLAPHHVAVLPLSQFTTESAEETGDSFVANALLKARYAARVAGLPAIADDSGLEVDALHGAPGIYSARYAGEPSSDAANNCKLLLELANVADEARTGRFHCVLAYVRHADDSRPVLAEAAWEGRILPAPRGVNGFGYDCVFQPADSLYSCAELSATEKNRLSHRSKAMQKLLQLLHANGDLET